MLVSLLLGIATVSVLALVAWISANGNILLNGVGIVIIASLVIGGFVVGITKRSALTSENFETNKEGANRHRWAIYLLLFSSPSIVVLIGLFTMFWT
ncbi:hypothetical protein [Geomicrobium sp. JCM 19039]|uniref:hypothetical protein n=1 Tax=Geomicrobium sp. JCM 19039 TaxID=1460636 RepID=UPI00045F1FE2|nr:hypothetical protein [Geomicrobium sp. JCM 19039]GAK13795.1 hypothetical protein JCM19039_3672 [Geomicrobium sp. JCM 19039]